MGLSVELQGGGEGRIVGNLAYGTCIADAERREQLGVARYAATPVLSIPGGIPEEEEDPFADCRFVAKPVSIPRLAAVVGEILGR